MTRRTSIAKTVVGVQCLVAAALAGAIFTAPQRLAARTMAITRPETMAGHEAVAITRRTPLVVAPLFDRPDLVSDDELAAVLRQVQPRMPLEELKPNHVEHALRTWGVNARFQDPAVRSGAELQRFLTDTASFLESWGPKIRPLLEEQPRGLAVRWGSERCGSVHHDHLLACLTEGGAPLDTPVFGPSRRDATLNDVLQQALADFRLDERETEWTALAFAMWLPPTSRWTGGEGRQYSFDLLARRLMRGQKEHGVCSGTHRVYTLTAMLRIDEEHPEMLSDAAAADVWSYLEGVSRAIQGSQFLDGHWPSNWPDGADALVHPADDELRHKVISTGHHLEWLSIAPAALHPPEEQIHKAMRWIIDTTVEQSPESIRDNYTFFSHVGSALAGWRKTHPAVFWEAWERDHPFQPGEAAAAASDQ